MATRRWNIEPAMVFVVRRHDRPIINSLQLRRGSGAAAHGLLTQVRGRDISCHVPIPRYKETESTPLL